MVFTGKKRLHEILPGSIYLELPWPIDSQSQPLPGKSENRELAFLIHPATKYTNIINSHCSDFY